MAESLVGKNILVTGASSGIGYQAALDLARAGAFVILHGRDETRCENARAAILESNPGAAVAYLVADLSSQRQVRRLAEEAGVLLAQHGGKLDVLVNNAGLYSSSRVTTEDGIELTFAVNHLAPFLLTHLLLPALSRAPEGRVLGVSSASHYHSFLSPLKAHNPALYIGLPAYATSNLSRVLFSAEFNRRTSSPNLHAWSIDPGLVDTEIGLKDKGRISRWVWKSRKNHGTSTEIPSRTIMHLVTSPFNQVASDLYWKDSAPKPPNPASRDPMLAARLWELSCRLCGISNYFK